MTPRLFLLIHLIFGTWVSSSAQITLAGSVFDSGSQAALPFVNIGIRGKNIGAVSLADGTFSIKISMQNEHDTLTFSMVGYEELNLSIKNITAASQHIFLLKQKPTVLDPVAVTAGKLSECSFGIKNNRAALHFSDGSTNQDDIFEIAQLIKFGPVRSRVTSVNLYINQLSADSGIFRINFYRFRDGRPAERMVEKSIVQKKKIREGWLTFDLAADDVYLEGSFVVALEFIPTGKKSSPIYYEIKLGGSARSFVRTSSQGEWTVPPHHYRLFITALVADEKNRTGRNDADEKETLPAKRIFSEAVKDSFSVFVHLPKGDVKKRKQSLPVIYLLDANVYFDLVANAMEENHVKAILVGIGYKDFLLMDSLRNRDYLYPKVSSFEGLPVSGGANQFLTFIERELMPYINKTYAADTDNQTLMGHSFGGYFVLYALLEAMQQQHSIFKNYVAASPALDYSHRYLLEQFQRLPGDSTGLKNLVVTYGGKEDLEDGGTGTEGIDNFNALVSLLSCSRYRNIALKSEIYPSYRHMETAVPTFSKAVKGIK